MEESKNKFHALQLFTDTFAAETVHLTNEQVGIYIRYYVLLGLKMQNLLHQNQLIEFVNVKMKIAKSKSLKF